MSNRQISGKQRAAMVQATGLPVEIRELPGGHKLVIEPFGGPCEFASDRDSWEQQPNETNREYLHFKYFRDLEAEDRTLATAWRTYVQDSGGWKKGISPTPAPWYSMAANQWRWRERAAAYDLHMDKLTMEALQAKRIRARVETAELGRTMRMKAMNAARLLQALTTEKVIIDGKQRTIVRSNLSPQSIVALAKVGSELERIALGMEQPGGQAQVAVNVDARVMPMDDNVIVSKAEQILEARKQLIDAEVTAGSDNGD